MLVNRQQFASIKKFIVVVHQTAVSNNCADTAINCNENQNLCHMPQYVNIMKEKCKKTCNFCDDNTTNKIPCADFILR